MFLVPDILLIGSEVYLGIPERVGFLEKRAEKYRCVSAEKRL
ncbi:MAG: hypothetical protein QG606_70 [Patescibacteria group bacterium]|jgi:hypothetical protein|nr:hypothetical protein [Patescibacteria group bacterium]